MRSRLFLLLCAGWAGSAWAGPARIEDTLQQRLAALAFDCWPGLGRDPGGEWPPEESLFVPGLGLDAACLHGRYYGQNAILHAAADAVPRLVWLEPSR